MHGGKINLVMQLTVILFLSLARPSLSLPAYLPACLPVCHDSPHPFSRRRKQQLYISCTALHSSTGHIPWSSPGHSPAIPISSPYLACLPARLPRNQALLDHRSCQAIPAKPPRQPRFLIPQHPGYSASGLQHGTSRPRCNQRYACQNHALDKTPRET